MRRNSVSVAEKSSRLLISHADDKRAERRRDSTLIAKTARGRSIAFGTPKIVRWSLQGSTTFQPSNDAGNAGLIGRLQNLVGALPTLMGLIPCVRNARGIMPSELAIRASIAKTHPAAGQISGRSTGCDSRNIPNSLMLKVINAAFVRASFLALRRSITATEAEKYADCSVTHATSEFHSLSARCS